MANGGTHSQEVCRGGGEGTHKKKKATKSAKRGKGEKRGGQLAGNEQSGGERTVAASATGGGPTGEDGDTNSNQMGGELGAQILEDA